MRSPRTSASSTDCWLVCTQPEGQTPHAPTREGLPPKNPAASLAAKIAPMCAASVPISPVAFAPLAGVRVVDLTSSLAGPWCTAILAALGADVVKVERPGAGDEARDWGPPFFPGGSVMFFAANADKRSLALDLKRGSEVLLRLAEGADVLVQSLRPGAAERLGIGHEAVRAR